MAARPPMTPPTMAPVGVELDLWVEGEPLFEDVLFDGDSEPFKGVVSKDSVRGLRVPYLF